MDDTGLDLTIFGYRIPPLLDDDLQPSQREQASVRLWRKLIVFPIHRALPPHTQLFTDCLKAYKGDRFDGLRIKLRKRLVLSTCRFP